MTVTGNNIRKYKQFVDNILILMLSSSISQQYVNIINNYTNNFIQGLFSKLVVLNQLLKSAILY